MSSVHVDEMNVLKVREVAKEVVARARRGNGPTLVEYASPLPQHCQLLENVFANLKRFGIRSNGRYRCEDYGFIDDTTQV
ncbi:hypothetical protein SUGI_0882690 [Cryptomeria japonica]|nr:hypothetical protein SUGI_0882690 [Cryptomeria japonica]